MIRLYIGRVFNFLNRIIPKQNKNVISSFPDFDDMTRGLIPFLEGRTVILLRKEDQKPPVWLPDNIQYYKKNSLLGFYHIFTSKTVYFTHGLFGFFKVQEESKQKVINLWHGMPLKNIGLLDGKKVPVSCHKVLSTSVLFQRLMAKAFGLKIEDVLLSGLPRNDILQQATANIELIKIKNNYDNVYVWLPTYRKSTFGDIRQDGACSSLYGFDDFDIERLNETLQSNNEVLFVKPHPMASYDNKSSSYSNVRIIDEQWLSHNNTSLYELLSISDGLWTDYSSVFVDYIVTNKPILFIVPDLSSYQESRGFTFDINSIELPGVLIKTEKELFSVLNEPCAWKNQYDGSMFNSIKLFDIEILHEK